MISPAAALFQVMSITYSSLHISWKAVGGQGRRGWGRGSAGLEPAPPALGLYKRYLDTSSHCRVSPPPLCPRKGSPAWRTPGTCGSDAASPCHMSWSTGSMRSTGPTCHHRLGEKGSVRPCLSPRPELPPTALTQSTHRDNRGCCTLGYR